MGDPAGGESGLSEQPIGDGAGGERWAELVDRYLQGYFEAHPSFAAGAGRHEFDGRLPDWSAGGLAAEARRLEGARGEVAAFDPRTLAAAARFEREMLLAHLDGELFWLQEAESPAGNPLFYSSPLDPNLYLARDYAPLADRLRAYLDYARAVPRAAAEIRKNLRPPLARPMAELGRATFGGLAAYYEEDVPRVFAPVEDAALQRELARANAAAAIAMRALAAWLAAPARERNDGFALGPERFAAMLRATERVEIPLDRLKRAGEEELARNLDALREAAGRYAPGATVEEAVARAQAEKPVDGPVAEARRQIEGLHAFVVERDLAGIPEGGGLRIEEAPPYQRWNSAYIDIPGPYDRHLPAVYYIAPPDPAWSPEERAAYLPATAELLFTSVHEAWPGHFLQFLHSNRAASAVGRLFVGYGFAEGWAHYAEELVWEEGLGEGDPLVHIGQLQNALLRNVRYLVAIGLHAEGMTLGEAERRFRGEAFLDPQSARQQAHRGAFDPAYLNYTLGKLVIRKLRADWKAADPGGPRRGSWRSFHDRLLSYGGPPLPLVRQAMLGDGGGGGLL
jgi:hypothetical protein